MMDLLSDMGKADAARMGKWLGTFEAALTKSGSGFLVGDKLTYADLACFKILEAAAATGKAETPALLASWRCLHSRSHANACGAQGAGSHVIFFAYVCVVAALMDPRPPKTRSL